MRRGDAKPRRAARSTTIADRTPGARGLRPRAFRAKRSTQTRAKAQLSLGYYLVTKSIVTGMPSSSNRSRSWFSTQ